MKKFNELYTELQESKDTDEIVEFIKDNLVGTDRWTDKAMMFDAYLDIFKKDEKQVEKVFTKTWDYLVKKRFLIKIANGGYEWNDDK